MFRIRARQKPEDYFLTYSERVTFASIKALTEQYKVNASNSADLARRYAEENEDVNVEAGTYSSKHWSIKSEKKFQEIKNYVGSTSDPESALGSIESARASAVSDVNKQKTDSIEAVGTYTSNTAIPSVSQYVESTAKPALKTYGEQQVDSYVNGTSKLELDRYVNNEKKQVLDNYTSEKKSELDNYTETDKKQILDSYTENDKKTELDTHTEGLKEQLNAHTLAKSGELNEYTTGLKSELDGYTTAKEQDISEFTEQKKTEIQGVYQNDLNELKGDLDKLYQGIEEGYINIDFTLKDGYVNYSDGSISNYGSEGVYKRTDYILLDNILSNYTESIEHNFVSQGVTGVAFFDINKTFISGTTNNIIPINDIPTNAKYIMLSDYDLSKTHADKKIIYILTEESIKNVATKITSYYDSETIIPPLRDGYVNYTNYNISNYGSEGYYKRTEYIEIPTNCKYIEHNFSFSGTAGYVFFNASKVGVFGGNSSNRISVPNNAKYVMFSSYSLSKNHENRKIQFVYYDYTIKGNGERIDRRYKKL